MSKGMKVASWIAAIGMVLLCYGTFIGTAIVGSLLGEPATGPYASSAEDMTTAVFCGFLIAVPVMQVICIIFGILAATNKETDTVRTTRLIMLVVKLSLIPFFIIGGITIAMFILAGIHPVLIAFGWGTAAFMAICGWFTVISGSVWSIATAVQLHRAHRISSGETALHIILQFFFVADVVDAIVLFVRSAPTASAAQDRRMP